MLIDLKATDFIKCKLGHAKFLGTVKEEITYHAVHLKELCR